MLFADRSSRGYSGSSPSAWSVSQGAGSPWLFVVVVVRAAQQKIEVGQEGDDDQGGDLAEGRHEARLLRHRDNAHAVAFRAAHRDRAEVRADVCGFQAIRFAVWNQRRIRPANDKVRKAEGALARLAKRLMPDVRAAMATEPAVGGPSDDAKLFVYVGSHATGAGRRTGTVHLRLSIRRLRLLHIARTLTHDCKEPYGRI